MPKASFGLTDKEREVLRLLAQGHDVKSAAATLRLSVHTVNERLREARVKTQTSSSRGAARLLAEREDPRLSGSAEFGVTAQPIEVDQSVRLHGGPAEGSRTLSQLGRTMMMSAVVAAAAFAGAYVTSNERSAPAAPTVVSTTPDSDAVVPPGRIRLRVTFDRPMQRQRYSFVRKSTETYPECDGSQPTQSADGRTFTLTCQVRSGQHYEIWFNSAPYMNFVDEKGVAAIPYGLRFRTK